MTDSWAAWDLGLKYGPVGDPTSSDPFERTQARMPPGWHVEGQVAYGMWKATDRVHRDWLEAASPELLINGAWKTYGARRLAEQVTQADDPLAWVRAQVDAVVALGEG